MLKIKKLPFAEAYPLMLPMLPAHYEEACWRKDRLELAPRTDKYAQLCRSGNLHMWLLFDGGECIGYSVWVISPHLHYSGTLFGTNDLLYIEPKHRHKHTDWFVGSVHGALRSLGVDCVTYHMKPFKPFEGLMRRQGAEVIETLYGLWLR